MSDCALDYIIPDNRICGRCGARAGGCGHLDAEPVVRRLHPPEYRGRPADVRWDQHELDKVRRLYAAGWNPSRIADNMNRGVYGVKAQIYKLGMVRGQPEC